MAEKIKLTRPELKRRRDALALYRRYLPTLKLKQQQLQMSVLQAERRLRDARAALAAAEAALAPYRGLLRERAGVDLATLARPSEVRTSHLNVAGLRLPVFQEARFPEAGYSLFSTPPWVDCALRDQRALASRRAEVEVLERQVAMLRHELTRVTQRVNLFEKVKLPQTREAIRVIRIYLGDEQTAGVGRAKIAKGKLAAIEAAHAAERHATAASAGATA